MTKPKGDVKLLVPFLAGELLTIQREVKDENVLYSIVVRDPCSLSSDRMVITGGIKAWGVSAYADGRVSRQAASIGRLLAHLQQHCVDPDCPYVGEGTP
jgi:hypothetical protein